MGDGNKLGLGLECSDDLLVPADKVKSESEWSFSSLRLDTADLGLQSCHFVAIGLEAVSDESLHDERKLQGGSPVCKTSAKISGD